MKKLLIVVCMMFALNAIHAQEGFRLGAHVGLATGDIDAFYGFNLGVDAAYMFNVAPNLYVGPATGFSTFFLKSDFEGDNLNLVPLAASGQYNFDGGFNVGLDLGYGFFTNEGADGGFLYEPKIGYQLPFGNLFAGYKGVSVDGGTVSAINVGLNHSF